MRAYARIVPLSAIVLCVLLGPTPPASADAKFPHAVLSSRFDLSGEFDLVNPCNGEQVIGTIEGQGHLLIVGDAGGGAHLKLTEEVHGHGETPDGTRYAVGQPLANVIHATFLSDRRVEVFVTNLHFNSAGSSDNFIAHAVQHLTITPDGTVTSTFTIISQECRG
jgi:hypothetical protein